MSENMNYKFKVKKMPELINGRVKRVGRTYYELWYTFQGNWIMKEFDTRKQAKDFLKSYE